jgi:hypothetical protein
LTAPLAGQPGLARRALTAAAGTAAVAAGAAAVLLATGPGPVRAGTAGLTASGAGTVVAILTVLLAGANGFSKAYSP